MTWILGWGGGNERKAVFANFCTGYRIYRHVDKAHASLVFEGVDLEKMKAILGSPEAAASKAKHTVIDPVEIYIEVEGGT